MYCVIVWNIHLMKGRILSLLDGRLYIHILLYESINLFWCICDSGSMLLLIFCWLCFLFYIFSDIFLELLFFLLLFFLEVLRLKAHSSLTSYAVMIAPKRSLPNIWQWFGYHFPIPLHMKYCSIFNNFEFLQPQNTSNLWGNYDTRDTKSSVLWVQMLVCFGYETLFCVHS